jgi:hypothetical protein
MCATDELGAPVANSSAPEAPVEPTRRPHHYTTTPSPHDMREKADELLHFAFDVHLRGTSPQKIIQIHEAIKDESKIIWVVKTHADKRRVLTIFGEMWLITWRQIVQIEPALSRFEVWDLDGKTVSVDFPVPCVAPKTPKDEEKPRHLVETDVSPCRVHKHRRPRDAEKLIQKNAHMIPADRPVLPFPLTSKSDLKEISIGEAVRLLEAGAPKEKKNLRQHPTEKEKCAKDFVILHLAISVTVALVHLYVAWHMDMSAHRLLQCERALSTTPLPSPAEAERVDTSVPCPTDGKTVSINLDGIGGMEVEKAPDVSTSTECDESGCRMKVRMKVDPRPTANNVPLNLLHCVFQSLEFNLHDDRLSKTFYMCEVDLRQFVVSPPGSVPSHLTNCEFQSLGSPLGNGIAEFAYYLCS